MIARKFIKKNSEPSVPDGLFIKCNKCNAIVYSGDVADNYNTCPQCGGYYRLEPAQRLKMVIDKDSFVAWDEDMPKGNPLSFPEYEKKLAKMEEKAGIDESVITGVCTISGIKTAIGVMSTAFMMGSMGHITGEKITRLFERATKENLPVIMFCCSGGARMQEGIVSLMQMEKTAQAVKRHSDKGLLYISVLTDPTTGGVMASFAMLADVILAEPGALIGFAGPRVIEQTIGQSLPKGFQTAEFLMEHGFVDGIVKRPRLKRTLEVIMLSSGCQKGNAVNGNE